MPQPCHLLPLYQEPSQGQLVLVVVVTESYTEYTYAFMWDNTYRPAGPGQGGVRGVPADGCGGGVLWSTETRLRSGCCALRLCMGSVIARHAEAHCRRQAGVREWFQSLAHANFDPKAERSSFQPPTPQSLDPLRRQALCHAALLELTCRQSPRVASRRSRNGGSHGAPCPRCACQLS